MVKPRLHRAGSRDYEKDFDNMGSVTRQVEGASAEHTNVLRWEDDGGTAILPRLELAANVGAQHYRGKYAEIRPVPRVPMLADDLLGEGPVAIYLRPRAQARSTPAAASPATRSPQ